MTSRGRTIEAAANRFAGEFLAPAETLRLWASQRGGVIDIEHLNFVKQQYGISLLATVRRHFDLELITEREYRDRCIQFHAARRVEPAPRMSVDQQEKSFFLDHLADALRGKGQNTTVVAHRLGISTDDLSELTFNAFMVTPSKQRPHLAPARPAAALLRLVPLDAGSEEGEPHQPRLLKPPSH